MKTIQEHVFRMETGLCSGPDERPRAQWSRWAGGKAWLFLSVGSWVHLYLLHTKGARGSRPPQTALRQKGLVLPAPQHTGGGLGRLLPSRCPLPLWLC